MMRTDNPSQAQETNQTKALADQVKQSKSYTVRAEDKAEAQIMLQALKSPHNRPAERPMSRDVRPCTEVLVRRYGKGLVTDEELARLRHAKVQYAEHHSSMEYHSVSGHNLRVREASLAYSANPIPKNARKLNELRVITLEDIAFANQAAMARKVQVVDGLVDLEIAILNRLAECLEADASNVSEAFAATYAEFGCSCRDELSAELLRLARLNRNRAGQLSAGRGRGEVELNPLFEAILSNAA